MSLLKSPSHPGEVLRELYLEPLGMSAIGLAKRLELPRTRIERIATEQTSITPDTALRLAKFFGTSPEFWINLQTGYDLKVEERALRAELENIQRRAPAA